MSQPTSRHGYRKMVRKDCLAVLSNGIDVPLAAKGLLYPVCAMVAMAASVTAIFVNSLWDQPATILRRHPQRRAAVVG